MNTDEAPAFEAVAHEAPTVEAVALSVTPDAGGALYPVSFVLPAGELALLTGPNGAGKSTLLRVLAGLIGPSAGTVTVAGLPPDHPGVRRRRGFLQDEPPLYDHLTVREHLLLAARLWQVPVPTARLDRYGLTQHLDRPAHALSLGSRKKLGLLIATAHEPGLILLDEPYNGLDHTAADLLTAELAAWRAGGRTVLMSTHAPDRVARLTDRSIALRLGTGQPKAPASP
ncbi:ATP-binding cassette domain-containing protein [Streptomyces sp. NPDC051561]|uniref:ATP-binding cassette domain-containing protein n=1 Tax=Streptomyces sp. NPDC051561 TaxID=3365658 RepID=UPI0037ABE168